MAGKKPDIRTDMKVVREKVEKGGPSATFANKPTRAAGRKAERIAARMQGEQANPKSKETSKTVRHSDQGSHKAIKRKKAA
ncbi:MAG TPA: hypothetical protein VD837_06300 [Terriglobales bacterium]|nr:hypothetical protein [Terriglobales bacterium]